MFEKLFPKRFITSFLVNFNMAYFKDIQKFFYFS